MNSNHEKQKDNLLSAAKYGLMLLPFIVGYIGFRQLDGVSVSWAAYYAVRLYGINTDLTEINPLIELARWTAPIVTATAVLLVVKSIYHRLDGWWRSFYKESCSVYGNGPDAAHFLENLGKNGVPGDLKRPLKTPYHVVFCADKQEALDFYATNKAFFDGGTSKFRRAKGAPAHYRVFLSMGDIQPLAIQQENVSAFSVSKNCAALYWAKHPAKVQEKIAVIGTGELCDALLEQGLLVNIFAPQQAIAYHVWNADHRFEQLHSELQNAVQAAGDLFLFHPGDWHENLKLLATMDRIILCFGENENLVAASEIISYLPHPPLHIYGQNGVQMEALLAGENLLCFGSAEELLTKELILKESLLQTAKKVHEDYRREAKRGTVPTWEALDTFKRQSNVAAASYFSVLRTLHAAGKTDAELTELEHIRWCRFHYLYNWQYGAQRNDARRIHPCLVPFAALTKEEKDKDFANVKSALSTRE